MSTTLKSMRDINLFDSILDNLFDSHVINLFDSILDNLDADPRHQPF
jgi:Rod binding domain-containing protein